MKRVLGKKQSITNGAWVEAFQQIQDIISFEEIQLMESIAIEEIRKHTAGKKVAYAWSGGKDSIVLGALCQKVGITDCMMGICNLEYPAFLNWVQDNKPKGLEIINTGQGLDWLGKHETLLFPQKSTVLGRWYSMVQHRAQQQYFKEHQLDMIMLGRRTADGNYSGKNGIYTNAKNVTRYSPIYAWSHEAVLGYIHYYQLSLPPIYDWKEGFRQGTHPWAARICNSQQDGWREVFEIDPSIVRQAAEVLESAKKFLEVMNDEN